MIDPTLPLVDLHRHLDGTVRLETVLDIGRSHQIALPADTVEGLRPYGQVQSAVPSLMDFIAKFDLLKLAFVDEDAIALICRTHTGSPNKSLASLAQSCGRSSTTA